jgi:hypothetical protein
VPAPGDLAVAGNEARRTFRYVAVITAAAGDSVGFGCVASGAGVSASEVTLVFTAAEHGSQVS